MFENNDFHTQNSSNDEQTLLIQNQTSDQVFDVIATKTENSYSFPKTTRASLINLLYSANDANVQLWLQNLYGFMGFAQIDENYHLQELDLQEKKKRASMFVKSFENRPIADALFINYIFWTTDIKKEIKRLFPIDAIKESGVKALLSNLNEHIWKLGMEFISASDAQFFLDFMLNSEFENMKLSQRVGILQILKCLTKITSIRNYEIKGIYKLELREIPSDIKFLKNLEVLELSCNKIAYLPAEIWTLEKLRDISISWNKLETLPSEIGGLKNLCELRVNNNQLSLLPPEIGTLENLEELGLANNNLRDIPEEIGQLVKLRVLDLSWNPLIEWEKEKITKLLPDCEIEF